MNIIIPSAGPGIRKNSNKPKIDVEFSNNNKLYEHQIDLLKEFYPSGTITYILGFHANKVEKQLKSLNCNTLINKNYSNNNIPYAINLVNDNKGLLVIYGDIFFSKDLLQYLPSEPSGSYIVKDITHNFHPKNIGVGPNGVMSFCFEQKWSQIVYFNEEASEYLNTIMEKPKNHKKFTFEIINEMRENHIPFDVLSGSGYCKEMDSIKDYNAINKWINNNENIN